MENDILSSAHCLKNPIIIFMHGNFCYLAYLLLVNNFYSFFTLTEHVLCNICGIQIRIYRYRRFQFADRHSQVFRLCI